MYREDSVLTKRNETLDIVWMEKRKVQRKVYRGGGHWKILPASGYVLIESLLCATAGPWDMSMKKTVKSLPSQKWYSSEGTKH